MNEIYNKYLDLISNPLAPRNYREIQAIYERIGNIHAAEAFKHVAQMKFQENANNTDSRPEKP